MSIPIVTFPLSSVDAASKAQELMRHIRASEAELRMIRSLLIEVRKWCPHEGSAHKNSCSHCGADWGD